MARHRDACRGQQVVGGLLRVRAVRPLGLSRPGAAAHFALWRSIARCSDTAELRLDAGGLRLRDVTQPVRVRRPPPARPPSRPVCHDECSKRCVCVCRTAHARTAPLPPTIRYPTQRHHSTTVLVLVLQSLTEPLPLGRCTFQPYNLLQFSCVPPSLRPLGGACVSAASTVLLSGITLGYSIQDLVG